MRMSWLVIIIVILVIAALLGVLFRTLTGFVRVAVVGLVIGGVIVGGVVIISDVIDLKNHFYQDEKLFVLEIDGNVGGAFLMGGAGIPDPLTDLRGIRSGYPDLAMIQGNAYKVIVMDWPVVADDLELVGFRATAQELRNALLSENPKQLFIDKAVEEYGADALGQIKLQADTLYPTRDSFAGTVFALLANKPLSNPDVFLSGLKSGSIVVFPETVTFKILGILPEGVARALVAPQQSE